MQSRLDELLVDSLRPKNVTTIRYIYNLRLPIGPLEEQTRVAVHQELLRIVRSFPDQDSPLARCRILAVLRALNTSLNLPANSFGRAMLDTVEASIPPRVRYVAHFYEIGFACFESGFDLYEQTLEIFALEKKIQLPRDLRQDVLETYALAIYHLGRSRLEAHAHRELILLGVHDAFNQIACRALGWNAVSAQEFAFAYENIVERWIQQAERGRAQSSAHALVRAVFNTLGLTSAVARMKCVALLDAGVNQMLEASELSQVTRVSADI